MKYLKILCVLIVGLLLIGGSIPVHAQEPAATEAQRKEIQEAIDKVNAAIKDKGKNDPSVKELADKAIALADKYYNIKAPDNLDGNEAEYGGDVKGEGVTHPNGKKGKVKIGPKAFTTPGWLASSKLHEFVHVSQISDGRWVVADPAGSKTAEINETEAYDAEIDSAKKTGLSAAEIAESEKRRKEHYDNLDEANQKKIDKEKAAGEPYKIAMLPATGRSMFALVRRSELFVAGNVLSEESMQVTFRGTSSQAVEGNVVTAEMNGKTTQTKTDKEGHAILDMSAIAGGLTAATVATIKLLDAKGNQISTVTTNVEPGHSMIFDRPRISELPANLPTGEVMTIPGQNLGADAHLVCGEQIQETLSASDKEMTVFTDCKTGNQPAFVITPNGVSQSQNVNVYSIDFNLPKSSITPGEVVAAQVHYESIPQGTKLIFTNNSTESVTMTIPGAQNTANECIYTVANPNGTIPVNITGKKRGGFNISLNTEFKDDAKTPD